MASHQTVRLRRGSHRSPAEGVCVMELASILAGEHFSDKPRAVSPVIGGFLRRYNDGVDDVRRQDLYGYASAAVGTRAPREVEDARRRRCLEWARDRGEILPWWARFTTLAQAGVVAGGAAAGDASPEAHRAALSFLDELIVLGGPPAAPLNASELTERPEAIGR